MFQLRYKPLRSADQRHWRTRLDEYGWFAYGTTYKTLETAKLAHRNAVRNDSSGWKVQVMRAG